MKVCTGTGGAGIHVVPNLTKCPVPVIPAVYTGGMPRYVSYRTHPWKITKNKLMFRNVVGQGTSKSHRIKNVDGYFFTQQCYAQANGPQNGSIPRTSNGWVLAMPQRSGGKRCLYRHKSSPVLVLTHRRRSARRQGVPSPRTSRCLVGDALSCLLYTSPSPRDLSTSRMPSSA